MHSPWKQRLVRPNMRDLAFRRGVKVFHVCLVLSHITELNITLCFSCVFSHPFLVLLMACCQLQCLSAWWRANSHLRPPMEGMSIRSAPKPISASPEANRLRGEMLVSGEGSLVQSAGSTGRCSRLVDDGFFSLMRVVRRAATYCLLSLWLALC